MRLISALLLSFMLAAVCQGRSMRLPRQAVVSAASSDETSVEDSVETGTSYEDDDSSEDPDWVPTYGDDSYGDYYSYGDEEGSERERREEKGTVIGATSVDDTEDDVVNDPDWLPTKEDYVEEDEGVLDYDSEEEGDDDDSAAVDSLVDDLWSSDDDPDWVPTADDLRVSEETDDDTHEDEDSSDSAAVDSLDDLWSSDDDPDWVPTAEDLEESETEYDTHEDDTDESAEDDEDSRIDAVLFDIALLVVEKGDLEVPGPDKVLAVFETLKDLDLTYEQALAELSKLSNPSENEIVPVIKAKRQVKTNIFSQANNPDRYGVQPLQAVGGIQQSLPDQYNAGDINSPSYNGNYDQGPWGSGQINQASGIQVEGSVIPGGQGNQPDIAGGVEPYYPQAVNPNEVASGVEPLDGESESTGSSVFNWLERGWNTVVDTADQVGDKVEDTFDDWGDKISGAASSAVDAARDAAQSAGESIVSTYHRVKGKIPELLERIRGLFTKFGVLVQTGAEYYIGQMEQAVDKVRQAEILDKLQKKLAEGNEQVTAFFQLLGQKCSSWTQAHGHENVDAGLITIQQVHPEEGVVGEEIVQVGGQSMPNWFQDDEVVEQLNQMMNSGILEQSDLDLLSQRQQEEGAQPQGPSQQQGQEQGSSPVIQSQSGNSRRNSRRSLRALIDALWAH